MMDLGALADFVLVATHGGFARAERITGRPKATLSRRVRHLEKSLGVRLLERDHQGLRLTAEGLRLYHRCRGPLGAIAEAEIAARDEGGEAQGLLRISAPSLFADAILGGIAASFVRGNRDVRVEIVAEDRLSSTVEDGFDLLIRVNPDASEDLVGRCFLKQRLVLVASPAALERAARGPLPSVVTAGRSGTSWTVNSDGRTSEVPHEPVITASSLMIAYHAILGGAGAGILPAFMASRHLEDGSMVTLGDIGDADISIWALHASRRLEPPRVERFVAHLISSFPDQSWPTAGFAPLFGPSPQ